MLSILGATNFSTTKSSAILYMTGVNDIGLRCLFTSRNVLSKILAKEVQ